MRPPAQERFESKVDRTGPCHLWTGAIARNGYGLFWAEGKMVLAHRWSYQTYVGPIPDGLQIDHVKARGCTSKACVNPAHLEPVTNRENQIRAEGFIAQRAAQTHCIRDHELTPENTRVRPNGTRNCIACEKVRAKIRSERIRT